MEGTWWSRHGDAHRTRFNVCLWLPHTSRFVWSTAVKSPTRNVSPYPLTFSDHRISEEAWEVGSPPRSTPTTQTRTDKSRDEKEPLKVTQAGKLRGQEKSHILCL